MNIDSLSGRRQSATRTRRRIIVALVTVLIVGLAAAATASYWKPVAKRSKWVVVGANLYQDLLRRAHIRTDQIGQVEGDERASSELPGALEAIDSTYAGYLEHGQIAPGWLSGKRVLELGPGDNMGVALRFSVAGAAFVSAIDKFVPLQTSSYHHTLYETLRSRLAPDEAKRFDEALDLSNRAIRPRTDRLEWVYGRGFEETDTYRPQSFDVIVSNAVLEEIYDIDLAFEGMDRLLRPGGLMLHKIDLRDYGMFTNHGFHPLEFLTVPDAVYRRMVESSGQPNRRLVDYYRKKTAERGYDTTIYTTWVLGVPQELHPHKTVLAAGVDYSKNTTDLIASIRPRLLPRYQSLPDEDLMVQGIYLVAHKPAGN